jgi:outer membrane protein assembly factor BamB
MHTLPSKLANFHVPSKAYQGYTLFAPLSGGGVWLVDMQGRFVHHWEVDHLPAAHGVLLPNGNLLYAGKPPDAPLEFGGIGGELLELDWDGNVLWKYEDPYMHHDFHRLPNGNTMVLRWVKTPDDITAKVKGGVSGTEREGVMWADSFREITPEGKVVWEWLGYEHLDPEDDAICPLCWRAEWTHANSCSGTHDGNVITALLTLNAIVIIDKATGDFKWRWGAEELAHPHNPNMLDNGNILVFDNGSHRPSSPTNPYGMMGGPSGRFFEVTPDKELVWEYINPLYIMGEPIVGYNNNVFLAHRYGTDYPGLKGRNLDPNKFELTLRKEPADEKKALEKRLGKLGY